MCKVLKQKLFLEEFKEELDKLEREAKSKINGYEHLDADESQEEKEQRKQKREEELKTQLESHL